MAVKFVMSLSQPLPDDWSGTPQQLFEAFLDRLVVSADAREFAVGSTEPEDGRPWFKNGTQLWVFNGFEYVPASTDESILPQVAITEAEPDPEKYTVWLKIAGSTVIGLYTYLGTETGWKTPVQELLPGSITEIKLAPGAITSSKFDDFSITGDKLADEIPTSKWELGASRQFLRMNALGTIPAWNTTMFDSPDIDLSVASVVEYEHNLGATPFHVSASLVCVTAQHGWVPGDLIPFKEVRTPSSGSVSTAPIFSGPTRVFTRFVTDITVRTKSGAAVSVITLANFKVRFHITAS